MSNSYWLCSIATMGVGGGDTVGHVLLVLPEHTTGLEARDFADKYVDPGAWQRVSKVSKVKAIHGELVTTKTLSLVKER